MGSYHVSDANSYLVITGGGIEDIKIAKKAWVLPWQKVHICQPYIKSPTSFMEERSNDQRIPYNGFLPT